MYLTKEQVQELRDTGIDEKIAKFAELFPNGTEVTYDRCIKYHDVFSFGCPGVRLMPPYVPWKPYWDKVLKAKHDYWVASISARAQRERIVRLDDNGNDIPEALVKRYVAQKAAGGPIFRWGPVIPIRIEAAPPEVIEASNKKLVRLTLDYTLALALLFYETSIS